MNQWVLALVSGRFAFTGLEQGPGQNKVKTKNYSFSKGFLIKTKIQGAPTQSQGLCLCEYGEYVHGQVNVSVCASMYMNACLCGHGMTYMNMFKCKQCVREEWVNV